jgi:hypothetical protein
MTIAGWLQINFDKPVTDGFAIAQEPITRDPIFPPINVSAGNSELIIDFGFETNVSRFRRALVQDDDGSYRLTLCS